MAVRGWVLQGHSRRDGHVVAVGPDQGDGVVRHGAAPSQTRPADGRRLARDLQDEIEALGGHLGGRDAEGDARVGDGEGIKAAAELVAVVERLDIILAGCCGGLARNFEWGA